MGEIINNANTKITKVMIESGGSTEISNNTLGDKSVLKSDVSSNALNGKTIACYGDSITSIDYITPNWWQRIEKNTGCFCIDYGISGTTLAHTNDRHLWDYAFKKLDADEIGYDENDSTTWLTGNCFCERFTKVDENADAIVIMGGTNDGDVPLGEWSSKDTSTLYGALNRLLLGISQHLIGKKILVCTPIQQGEDYNNNVIDPLDTLKSKSAEDTVSLQLRAEAIKQKCKQYGIPCLDLYNSSGINGADGTYVYYISDTDKTHPSEIGQIRLATLIQNKLEELFKVQ